MILRVKVAVSMEGEEEMGDMVVDRGMGTMVEVAEETEEIVTEGKIGEEMKGEMREEMIVVMTKEIMTGAEIVADQDPLIANKNNLFKVSNKDFNVLVHNCLHCIQPCFIRSLERMIQRNLKITSFQRF